MNYIMLPKSDDPEMMYVVSKWYKEVGDSVKAGDIIASYEEDKSVVDIESPYSGVVKEIYVAEGDPVPADTKICAIE